tara:strand:+ start:495 stop:935 length:441 start_codon:yes stop_codon:yes gene_type:complete
MSVELIELWHKRARPEPTDREFNVQLGCHLEEFAEMLAAIDSEIPETRNALNVLQLLTTRLGDQLKLGTAQVYIEAEVEFLDALADQIVTAVGVGYCCDMQITKAIDAVNASNWSKFDSAGQPIFNEHGKIMKGPNYHKPDLSAFV